MNDFPNSMVQAATATIINNPDRGCRARELRSVAMGINGELWDVTADDEQNEYEFTCDVIEHWLVDGIEHATSSPRER